MKHEPGSLLGSTSLVAGTAVGAGILAIPATTKAAGYFPSTGVILICWGFSCATGLLLAEVNLRTMCELGRGGASLLSMSKQTLGKPGEIASGVTYVFLHYALLVAYIARGGELLGSFVETSPALASILFTMMMGTLIYSSPPKVLDNINSVLVGAVVISFLVVLSYAFAHIDPQSLFEGDAKEAISCIPVIALAFVFHNVIPVIATNLEGDAPKIRTAIFAGTGIPLVMFLLWNAAILGYAVDSSSAETDPLKILSEAEVVGPMIQFFSLLAIGTSYIGFVLGLVDFLSDGMKLPVNSKNLAPYAFTLLPPLFFALAFPDAFLTALEVAGTFGVLTLFGILPAAMVWKNRKASYMSKIEHLVPGGTTTLVALGGFASTVILYESFIKLGLA